MFTNRFKRVLGMYHLHSLTETSYEYIFTDLSENAKFFSARACFIPPISQQKSMFIFDTVYHMYWMLVSPQFSGDGWVRQRCFVSCVTRASNCVEIGRGIFSK